MSGRGRGALACAAAWLLGCAGSAETGSTVIATLAEPTPVERAAGAADGAPELPIRLDYRSPGEAGDAYRIVLEITGERATTASTGRQPQPPLTERVALELEYRELPPHSADARDRAYLASLDAAHFERAQRNPDQQSEVELGDDRMRIHTDGKKSLDLSGSQTANDLGPRRLLGRVFASIQHDGRNNPKAMASKGGPIERRFLTRMPLLRAIGYSRLAFPTEPIAPGSVWRANRFPASRTGELGLLLPIEYSLAGFEQLDGIPCAWILLRGELDAANVPSRAGFAFDRVRADLSGMAWVELANSRVRRFVLDDEIHATYTQNGPTGASTHELRHTTRLVLDRRDPDAEPEHWADGSERFGAR